MLVLGLDFETQGSDAKTTNPTEVGAILYEYDPIKWANKFQEKDRLNAIIYEETYPPQRPEIVDLTGITDDLLKSEGRPRSVVWPRLLQLVGQADVVVAHKIAFDKTVLEAQAKLLGLEVPEKEWLCTLTNFDWPAKFTCRKLSHLAYEHSILVDPATLHRADNDVDLMMRLLGKYDFDRVLAYAREPWVYLRADICGPWVGRGGDGGVQKNIAVGLGFAWEKCKGTDAPTWDKKWVGRFKQSKVDAIREAVAKSDSPFRVSVIEGIS